MESTANVLQFYCNLLQQLKFYCNFTAIVPGHPDKTRYAEVSLKSVIVKKKPRSPLYYAENEDLNLVRVTGLEPAAS